MGHNVKKSEQKKVSSKSLLHILPLLLKSKASVAPQPGKLQNYYLGSLQQFKCKYNTNIEKCANTLRVQPNGNNLGRLKKRKTVPRPTSDQLNQFLGKWSL